MIKKLFGYFRIYEWILMIGSWCLIILSFALSPAFGARRSVLSTAASLVGVFGIALMSRGNIFAHYVYILFSCLYIAVSAVSRYYGEAIIYLAVMIPIHIGSIVTWKKHLSGGGEVPVDKAGSKHIWLYAAVAAALSVPFYFLLKALHTDNLVFSTLSLATSCLAAVLMLRRSYLYAFCFALDDLFLLLLWGAKIWGGGYEFIPTLITACVQLVNDSYGFYCWKKRLKKQREEEPEEKDRQDARRKRHARRAQTAGNLSDSDRRPGIFAQRFFREMGGVLHRGQINTNGRFI